MTKQEAKEKWCPCLQIVTQIGWKQSSPYSKKCIASECMMWRWEREAGNPNHLGGYCGLGGKP